MTKKNPKRGQNRVHARKCPVCKNTNTSQLVTCINCFTLRYYFPKAKKLNRLRSHLGEQYYGKR